MSNGWKYLLIFLGGAAAGATGLALLNNNKMDFKYMKPMATDLLSKGMNLKDTVVTQVTAIKENIQDMAAEARENLDAKKMAEAGLINSEAGDKDCQQ